jgi:hypothetical protein
VFDLIGRPRCEYIPATGNLLDPNTGKIVGHVPLKGNFVGASWLADELFGQRDDGKAHAALRGIAGMLSLSSSEEGAAVPGREPMLGVPDPDQNSEVR